MDGRTVVDAFRNEIEIFKGQLNVLLSTTKLEQSCVMSKNSLPKGHLM